MGEMARDVVVRGQAGRSTKREISGAQHRDTAVSLSLFRKADSQRSSNPSAPKKYDSSTALIYRQAWRLSNYGFHERCRGSFSPRYAVTYSFPSECGLPTAAVHQRALVFAAKTVYSAVVQADGIMASCNRCEMWHSYNKLRFPEKRELSTAGKLTLEVGKWKRRWKVKGSERGL